MALPLDLDNAVCAEILRSELRQGVVSLVEQFPPPERVCCESPEGHFVHEVVVPLRRPTPPAPRLRQSRDTWTACSSSARVYWPGGEWLSISVFAGEQFLDRLLISAIAPQIQKLRDAGLVKGWFFIRYWEPSVHLRIRLRGDPEALRSAAWPALLETLKPFTEVGSIHDIRIETYRPEISRYGGAQTIEAAEHVFEADSDMALGLIALDDRSVADGREQVALAAIDDLLDAFGFDVARRDDFARHIAESLRLEINFEGNVGVALGDRFRKVRQSLVQLLDPSTSDRPDRLVIAARRPAIVAFRTKCESLERSGELSVPLTEIMSSIAHMSVIRLIAVRPRFVEFVIYEMLRRSYTSERVRGRHAPR